MSGQSAAGGRFIVDVQQGQFYFYLAKNGQPFGPRRGPYDTRHKVETAADALARVTAQQNRGAPSLKAAPMTG